MTEPSVAVDSRVVDRALRQHFWPRLTEAGFARRAGRTAWRDAPGAIQVVNIQSFNSYLADVQGTTTFSFTVNLGVFLEALADRTRMTQFVRDRTKPLEYQCHLRMAPVKGLDQSAASLVRELGGIPDAKAQAWRDRSDVWYVLPNGTNLDAVAIDAVGSVVGQGLPWFASMTDPREVVRVLRERPDQHDPSGKAKETYGGALESPGRWQKVGALAAALGDRELLAEAVAAMSEQDFWKQWPEDLATLRGALSEMDAGAAARGAARP